MKFEITAFYPECPQPKNSHKIGGLSIKLVDINLELKGIKVFKNGKTFFFEFPGSYGVNERNEKVKYSFFHFLDKEMKKCLDNFLKEEFYKTFP